MLWRYMQLDNTPFLHGSPYPQLCSQLPMPKESCIVTIRIYCLGERTFKETANYRVLIYSWLKHFIWIAWLD